MNIATVQSGFKVSSLAMLVLILTLVQGTSTTLTLVYHFFPGSPVFEPLVNMLWAAMYMLSLVGLISSFGINWISWLVRYRLLLTLLLMGTAFSAMWSVDIGLTLERFVHLLGTTLIAFYIGFTVPLTRIVATTAWVLGLLMIASVSVVFGLPALGIENYEGTLVWRGVMTSKNTLGFWAAICVLACLVNMASIPTLLRKLPMVVLMLVSILALVMSVSATSFLALGLSLLFMSYLYIAYRFQLGLVSMAVLGLLCLSVTALAFLNIDTAELIGRSGDLTGRGEVWQQTWKIILQKPLTGYGYGTIWYPTDETVQIQATLMDFTWKVFHAHNGALQLASEIGIPLTFLAFLMIIQQLIEIVYCQYQRQQAGVLFVLGFTVALLASNYSEARLLVTRELYWIFFVALPISMLQQVTLIMNSNAFNPIPAPLHKRTRNKQASNADSRKRRKALKLRLQQQLESRADVDNSSGGGTVIEGEASTASGTGAAGKPIHANQSQKMARRQKKL